MNATQVDEANYETILRDFNGILLAHKPVCPHCRNMKIVIEKFIRNNGDIDTLELDTEANPVAMSALQIERVPTLLIIENGEIRQRKAGLISLRELSGLYNQA